MNLQNYQLVKEEDWYYLAKKRLAFSNYNLDEFNQWKPHTLPSSKLCSPASTSKLELTEQSESKTGKNLSPLVLNQKVFDIAGESLGRSSPLTVKSDQGSSEPRRLSRESCGPSEKRLSAEGISLEGSMLKKVRGRELYLKMKGSHESISSGERRKSNETSDDISAPREQGVRERELVIKLKEKDLDGKKDEQDYVDSPISTVASESFDSPTTLDSVSFSVSGTGSHMTSAVQSPVVSDVSIQLTKTDGRCEPFRSSPDRNLPNADMVTDIATDSFDSEDQNEAVLKRCSSFAGFRSEESCTTIKDEESFVETETSPDKSHLLQTVVSQGRLRHCSAPVAGHGTPRSKVSTLPYTPSCISSRGSFTEDGKTEICL